MKSSRTLEFSINRSQIVDQMAAWLYAAGVVNDNEDITNIQFGDLFGVSDRESVKLKVFLNGKVDKEEEVIILDHNEETS